MYLLTEWEGRTGKYLARGQGVRTERSEVMRPDQGAYTTGVMWSTLKISSGAQLGHDKRVIPAFNTVLFHSNLGSLRRKYLSDVPKDKIVLNSGLKISKRPLKRRYWWLKNKERKCHFRFVERRFLAAINFTGSAE